MTGLYLRLAPSGDAVLLTADADLTEDFGQLISRYISAYRISPNVAEVDLEDFLANLVTLGTWRHDPVNWDSELAHLVRTNSADLLELKSSLQSDMAAEAEWIPAADWIAPLTDCQVRDIRRLMSLSHGANFSVPGAGKTRVALAVYHARKMRGQVDQLLIVCPKSAYGAWTSENLECFPRKPISMRIADGHMGPSEALIVNYERLPQMATQLASLMRRVPTMMVVDEGHRMKRGNAGVHGRTVLSLAPLARHRLILTGTPAPNGVSDLQNVMSFAWPGSGRSLVQRAVASGDLRVASRMLRPLFTRTTKSELALPPFEPRVARVELPPLHDKLYRALLGHFATETPDLADLGRVVMYLLMAADCPSLIPLGTTRYEPLSYMVPPLAPNNDEGLRELLRDLPSYEISPKYLAATQIATRNAELGRKTVIWSTFVRSLHSLQLMMRPLSPAVVHGGTPDRDQELRRFQNDGDCWVLLTNPATLGEGISLHHTANDAVYIDRDFAAGKYLQSLDRIHRLGLPPDAQVNVTILAATRTIDEVVDLRLAQKLRFMGAILDDPDVEQLADLDEEPSVAAGLTAEDVNLVLKHLTGDGS